MEEEEEGERNKWNTPMRRKGGRRWIPPPRAGAICNTSIVVTVNYFLYEFLWGRDKKTSVIIDLVCRTWKTQSRETLCTAMKEGSRGTGNGAILAERRLRPSFYLSTHSLSIRAHRPASQRRQPASFFYGTARPKTTIETEGRRRKPVDSTWNRSFQCQSFPPKRGD